MESTINESKTEFSSTNQLSKIELEEFELEASDNFKYLGSIAYKQMDPRIENLIKKIVEGKKGYRYAELSSLEY